MKTTVKARGTPLDGKESGGARGLNTEQVRASRAAHGDNRLTEQRRRGFWSVFLSNLNDPVIRILLIALALNLVLLFRESDWVETLGIAVSVLLATGVSTASQLGSEAAFARLRAESERETCRVRRDGAVCELPIDRLVVGDVVLLGAGDHIAADGRLIAGAVSVDQAAMTGESREVKKTADGEDTDQPSDGASLFRGCSVLSGEGVMVVRRVGDATYLGGISREVQQETRDSPLKLRLAKLARQISVLGYVAAVLVGAAFLFHAFAIDSGFRWEIVRLKLTDLGYLADTLLEALMLSLTVVVVAVPEGLPMMVAVVLSANVRRMVREQVLVRRSAGIEAAGSMDLLFTDKTGTLTDGRLSVGRLLCAEGDLDVPAALGEKRLSHYLLACHTASGASVGRGENGGRVAIGGNATDRALLESVLEDTPPKARVIDRLPFDSARKYAATVLRTENGTWTVVKGAPERLLPHLDTAWDAAGRVCPLDRADFGARVRAQAAAGERVLTVALCEGEADLGALSRGVMPPLSLVCAVTLCDRIRPEARGAVEALHRAGVQVVMITGDAPETASHIARTCGILGGARDVVLTGDALARLSDRQLADALPRLAVVARALPTDKSRLVRVAQEQERVVGMTGDGINDAPALRRADIGFAMGSGAPVARDAGDILVLDDNLASIVRAVLYGRNIFKSIRKFITLQLTMNFCAVAVSMLGPFIGVNAPVTVVQMLWINLIMDTLGGLAFAGEAADPSALAEPPKRRRTPILNRYMVNQIVLLGGYTVALYLTFLKAPTLRACFRPSADGLCHLTAFFALFIFCSVAQCFATRTDRLRPTAGLGRNRLFLVIMVAILAVQIGFVYLGGSVLRTVPLTARELALTAALSLSVLPAELCRKLLWRLGRRAGDKY